MNKIHGRENDSVAVVPEVEKSEVAKREEVIQQFWLEHDIFNTSIQTPASGEPKGTFIFYDGPPFATGTPHYGHILAGTIKDAIPRFWTMNGMRVERKWGWDCHGLPLENLIEKKLGLATKRDIETYGIKNFNEAARATVMEYADVWGQVVPRMGRWANMEDDYKTMDSTYTESVWWVFSELHKKGLVFEGFKTMHLCPRCGTTLSNFEVNQGYKDIKDIAVTIKLPLLDETGVVTDTALLVWTTTPWTLPGNLAAAVHNDIDYVKVVVKNETVSEKLILAKGRLAQLGDMEYEVVGEMKGSDLVGCSYQAPFKYLANKFSGAYERVAAVSDQKNIEAVSDTFANCWKIYHADYVEVGEEGTGAVHIAPAYGDDDMKLAQVNNIPIWHHVDTEGHFRNFVTDFAGRLVKPKDDDAAGVDHKDTDIEILKALQAAGRVFKKENITHSYPHCWRCDTPLLNYATTSWFVNVPKIKDELVAANQAVHWVPEHVGTNRFGKWLEGARDWAVSRQRYWGAPLPIWKNPTTGGYHVFGSLAELKTFIPKRNNQYHVVRHAEAESNLTGTINALVGCANPLTERGREQCRAIAETIKDNGITTIIHSGLERARETAERVAAELGLDASAIVLDPRIIEFQVGQDYEGKTWDEFNANYENEEEKFTKVIPGVENRRDLIKRVGAFLYDFESTHENQNVLIIGHGSSIFALECVAEAADMERTIELKKAGYLKNAEVKSLPFTPVPHNDFYELDYHRPYIDEVELVDTDGTKLVRVPDVFDCWFESGSMPYAQHHYMGENTENFLAQHFPAHFIAEGLDQTRGWFYSLIVLGTALFGTAPFKNVIVNGLALAEDGKKMSKSLRNYPDPMELTDRTGADAMRYYLLTSPIIRGEDLNFSEKEVLELQRKNIGRLHNVLAMYEMYADGTPATTTSDAVLDRFIVARLYQLITESTAGYHSYELDKATRPIADFIDDVSVWYLRRSRERLKQDSKIEAATSLRVPVSDFAVQESTSPSETFPRLVSDTQLSNPESTDKTLALGTLRFILRELAKVMAPVMPFYAEYLYRAVRTEDEPISVHLTAWPVPGAIDGELLLAMSEIRRIVTEALEVRTKAKVNVRQPLAKLTFGTDVPKVDSELFFLLEDEVNVKAVEKMTTEMKSPVMLDTVLTPALLAEGAVRELMRAVQDMRKQTNLEPADRITLTIATDEAGEAAVSLHHELISKTVGAVQINLTENTGTVITAGEYTFTVLVTKID